MNMTSIDLQPVLTGKNVKLRPLTTDDFEPLYQIASDPLIWKRHPSPLRFKRDVFAAQIFSTGITSKSTLVALDKKTSQFIGSSRFYDVDENNLELAIGFTFLARSHWGGLFNQEI